jgi:hypothetical protein
MRLLSLAVCVALAGLATRAEAGGFFLAVPPLRADVGALAVSGDGVHVGTQVVVGVHLASVWPRDIPVDVGVGLVSASVDDGSGTVSKATVHDEPEAPSFVGGYLDLSSRMAGGPHWRTWAGVRGEALRGELDDEGRIAFGGVARVAAEIYVGGGGAASGGSGGAALIGVFALGVYADLSYRDLAGPLGGVGVSSGVTMRVPFIVAGG